MAARLDAAVVAIRHLNKRAGEDAIYRGGGSIGFTGLARSVMAVGRDPDDPDRIILAAVKLNVARRPPSLAYRIVADGPYEPAHIAWEGHSERTAEDLIGRTRDEAAWRSKTAELSAAIRDLLESNGGSMAAGEACRALEEEGYELGSRDNLKRARAQAGVASTKQGYDSGWLWTIRTLVTGSVPSDPSSAISSKGPNSPKRPTKRPKGPISVTREEPDSSTPHPSSDDRAATFWGEDNSLLHGKASGSPKRFHGGKTR